MLSLTSICVHQSMSCINKGIRKVHADFYSRLNTKQYNFVYQSVKSSNEC